MPSIISTIAYCHEIGYHFYPFGIEHFEPFPHISAESMSLLHKWKDGEHVKNYASAATAELVIKALMFASDLEDKNRYNGDPKKYNFSAKNDKMEKRIANDPIIVAYKFYPHEDFAEDIGLPLTRLPKSNNYEIPKFFFNAKFIDGTEAETLAIANFKEKHPYDLKNKVLAKMGNKNAKHERSLNEKKEKSSEYLLDMVQSFKAKEENAQFVLIAGKALFVYRENIDHVIDYVNGKWQEVKPKKPEKAACMA